MRIVLKLSGESLKGDSNIDTKKLEKICSEIREIGKDNELLVVVGGGNFWRGRNSLNISSATSDYMGMLGTIMNALAMESYLNKDEVIATCYSAFEVLGVVKKAILSDVLEDLKKGKIVILGGGLGVPNLSTDMTTVSKAIEYDADLILMAKNVDGIYDRDPKNSDAKKLDTITHEELLNLSLSQGVSSLLILDAEALVELTKHKIPLYVYKADEIDNIEEVISGEKGTRVIT